MNLHSFSHITNLSMALNFYLCIYRYNPTTSHHWNTVDTKKTVLLQIKKELDKSNSSIGIKTQGTTLFVMPDKDIHNVLYIVAKARLKVSHWWKKIHQSGLIQTNWWQQAFYPILIVILAWYLLVFSCGNIILRHITISCCDQHWKHEFSHSYYEST